MKTMFNRGVTTDQHPRFTASIRRWFNRVWCPRPTTTKAVRIPADPLKAVSLSPTLKGGEVTHPWWWQKGGEC